MSENFKYFSSVFGKVVPRFGTDVYIGCKRTNTGFEWDEKKVVCIPESEIVRYHREYTRVIKEGSIVKRTKTDYDASIGRVSSKEEDTAKSAADSELETDDKTKTVKKKSGGKK